MNSAYAKAKYFHSLKSMDLARNIASELGIFDEDEIVVKQDLAKAFLLFGINQLDIVS